MMIESAKIFPLSQGDAGCSLMKGVVVTLDAHCALVTVNKRELCAAVAFSCLVKPIADDVVLLAGNDTDGFHILHVLERSQTQDMLLQFPGSTAIHSPSGSLDLFAKDSVNVASKKLNCIAEQTLHKSQTASVDYGIVSAIGQKATVSIESIKVLSQLISTLATHTIQKFRTYIRHTESSEQVRAGQSSHQVKGMYTMDSKYTVMVSKKDTKIDGERIHVG